MPFHLHLYADASYSDQAKKAALAFVLVAADTGEGVLAGAECHRGLRKWRRSRPENYLLQVIAAFQHLLVGVDVHYPVGGHLAQARHNQLPQLNALQEQLRRNIVTVRWQRRSTECWGYFCDKLAKRYLGKSPGARLREAV